MCRQVAWNKWVEGWIYPIFQLPPTSVSSTKFKKFSGGIMFDHHALLYGHLQWVPSNWLLTLPVCLRVHPLQSSGFLGSLVDHVGCPCGQRCGPPRMPQVISDTQSRIIKWAPYSFLIFFKPLKHHSAGCRMSAKALSLTPAYTLLHQRGAALGRSLLQARASMRMW